MSVIESTYQTWAERNGFTDWAMALIWLVLCVVVFQIIAMLLAGAGYALYIYFFQYPEFVHALSTIQHGDTSFIANNLQFLFVANSTWQILFLGLCTYWFVRTCSGKDHRKTYLRMNANPSVLRYMGFAVLLIIAVQPAIWFLGWINLFVPVPDFFKNLQQSQMELITNFLKNNDNVLFALFNVAMVPAVCEEILFRGFVFRSFEKGWGVKVSIILSGLLFGLYHIQLSNLLPLAGIGMLLAVIAWSADSIYPAMVAHFINNGASVIVAIYYPDSAMADLSPEAMPPIWMVLLSVGISAYLIYLLLQNQPNRQQLQQEVAP